MIQQPSELIRFISGIPVLNDGTVPVNTLDSEAAFKSDLYTATYAVSSIARITQDVLNSDKIEVVDVQLEPGTIIKQALNSDLASYAPSIYLLVRMTVLESFALLYHIENDTENLQYVSTRDIKRIRENLNYIADYMGTEPKYYSMIEVLRHTNISFGYLQHQIDVIMNSKGVR